MPFPAANQPAKVVKPGEETFDFRAAAVTPQPATVPDALPASGLLSRPMPSDADQPCPTQTGVVCANEGRGRAQRRAVRLCVGEKMILGTQTSEWRLPFGGGATGPRRSACKRQPPYYGAKLVLALRTTAPNLSKVPGESRLDRANIAMTPREGGGHPGRGALLPRAAASFILSQEVSIRLPIPPAAFQLNWLRFGQLLPAFSKKLRFASLRFGLSTLRFGSGVQRVARSEGRYVAARAIGKAAPARVRADGPRQRAPRDFARGRDRYKLALVLEVSGNRAHGKLR